MAAAPSSARRIPIINCSLNNTALLSNSECFYLVYMNTVMKKKAAMASPYGFSIIRMIAIRLRNHDPLISRCSLLCDRNTKCPLPKKAHSNFVLRNLWTNSSSWASTWGRNLHSRGKYLNSFISEHPHSACYFERWSTRWAGGSFSSQFRESAFSGLGRISTLNCLPFERSQLPPEVPGTIRIPEELPFKSPSSGLSELPFFLSYVPSSGLSADLIVWLRNTQSASCSFFYCVSFLGTFLISSMSLCLVCTIRTLSTREPFVFNKYLLRFQKPPRKDRGALGNLHLFMNLF